MHGFNRGQCEKTGEQTERKREREERERVSFPTISRFWTQWIKIKQGFKVHPFHCPLPFLSIPLKISNSPTLFVLLGDLIASLLNKVL